MPPRTGSLLVLFLTVFVDLLGFGIVLPLLPIYAREFTADGSGLVIGLLMASFSAMQFFFAPVWGRLSDHMGRRPVLMAGLAGSVAFYALFGLATVWKSLTWLFVSRIGAGIFGATIPTAQAYIADTTPLSERPKGMAIIGAAFGLGFTFGPLFGYLAVPSGQGDPGPAPGYVAAGLSAFALLLAIFKLPESKTAASPPARRLFDAAGIREALRVPSIALLMAALFVCVFSFGNFETTLSILLKGSTESEPEQAIGPFRFSFREVCLSYAYIGLVLMLVQGGVVRRLAGRVPEGTLATCGAALQVGGFLLLIQSTQVASAGMLFAAMALVVTGFALMIPTINSLISRRSDPARQGGVLGLGQSVSSLARILGPLAGLPLLYRHVTWPFWLAAGMMGLGAVVVVVAARGGRDYQGETQ